MDFPCRHRTGALKIRCTCRRCGVCGSHFGTGAQTLALNVIGFTIMILGHTLQLSGCTSAQSLPRRGQSGPSPTQAWPGQVAEAYTPDRPSGCTIG